MRIHRVAALTLAVLAFGPLTVVLAQTHGPSHDPVPTAAAQTPASAGKVNAVDARRHTVNLTHDPIPVLGWPGMTMDFGVAPSVDLAAVKPGDTVSFTVSKTPDGIYLIDTLKVVK